MRDELALFYSESREAEVSEAMHGFIFSELKKYVAKHFGEEAWEGLLRQAGLGVRSYENFRDYPDDEVVALVATASQMTKLPAADILEGFGEFIAPDLVAVYRPLIDPRWRTLEFLENVESVIHRVVRARNQKAKPPAISCSRIDADEVMITYGSKRKLCAVARGIVQGTANHFGEEVVLREDSCMLRGDRLCLISVRRLKPAPALAKADPAAVPAAETR